MTEKLLTTAELAERLGVSTATILQRVKAGKLPVIRLSAKTVRFDYQAVLRRLRQNGDEQ